MPKNSSIYNGNMSFIKKMPVPIAGLILALLSLGNLLQDVSPYLRYLFAAAGIVILILLVLKVIFYPDMTKNDFRNPVIASSSGTFSMSLMILSTYIIPFMPTTAYTLWIIGIGLHILLMIYFICHFIVRDFDISNVYPSYWIVFVGITMAAITSPAHGSEKIGFIFFIIGFAAMLLTLPPVIYRYIRHPKIPDMNKPLICIFTAVLSILIVGYLNSAQIIFKEFAVGLYLFACIFYIFALYKFIEYRNLEFYPSFAAFTFPFVISAIATKGIVTLTGSGFLMRTVLSLQTIIAVIIVLYILVRYIIFLKKSNEK